MYPARTGEDRVHVGMLALLVTLKAAAALIRRDRYLGLAKIRRHQRTDLKLMTYQCWRTDTPKADDE